MHNNHILLERMRPTIRSAKRGANERRGVHSWHPYYAGYSEQFVEDMLNYFGANERSIVLDPWIGSGTTSLVCQRARIKTIGIEINPVMVHFSRAKVAQLLNENVEQLAMAIVETAQDERLDDIQDKFKNVEEYLDIDDFISLSRLRVASDRVCNARFASEPIREHVRSFFYSVLFRVLRSVGKFDKGRNPTWLVKQEAGSNLDKPSADELFLQFIGAMVHDLFTAFDGNLDLPLPSIMCADSRVMPLDSESVDYVITSPPYLTRIDYAVSTKPELLFFGLREDMEFDRLRRSVMGAPVIADKGIVPDENWGALCTSFLYQVENHTSKAAKSYYLPIFLQYFRDAFLSLLEIKRVLKRGGKACLVVQSSYFKELEVKLGDIYVEMGVNIGLRSEIIRREIVKQHLAHVNTKSSRYVRNKVYYEDCVLFTK